MIMVFYIFLKGLFNHSELRVTRILLCYPVFMRYEHDGAMKEQSQIRLSSKDWKAFEKILNEAETKPRSKLKKLIKDFIC